MIQTSKQLPNHKQLCLVQHKGIVIPAIYYISMNGFYEYSLHYHNEASNVDVYKKVKIKSHHRIEGVKKWMPLPLNVKSDFLLSMAEEYQNRCIKAEKFIANIIDMPWYKRFFLSNIATEYIEKYIKSTSTPIRLKYGMFKMSRKNNIKALKIYYEK